MGGIMARYRDLTSIGSCVMVRTTDAVLVVGLLLRSGFNKA